MKSFLDVGSFITLVHTHLMTFILRKQLKCCPLASEDSWVGRFSGFLKFPGGVCLFSDNRAETKHTPPPHCFCCTHSMKRPFTPAVPSPRRSDRDRFKAVARRVCPRRTGDGGNASRLLFGLAAVRQRRTVNSRLYLISANGANEHLMTLLVKRDTLRPTLTPDSVSLLRSGGKSPACSLRTVQVQDKLHPGRERHLASSNRTSGNASDLLQMWFSIDAFKARSTYKSQEDISTQFGLWLGGSCHVCSDVSAGEMVPFLSRRVKLGCLESVLKCSFFSMTNKV